MNVRAPRSGAPNLEGSVGFGKCRIPAGRDDNLIDDYGMMTMIERNADSNEDEDDGGRPIQSPLPRRHG